MTWDAFAALTIGSKPVWLYRVRHAGTDYFYTSRARSYSAAPVGLTIDFFAPDDFFFRTNFFEETFVPRVIKHSSIRQTQNDAKKQVTVTVPRTDVLTDLFAVPQGIIENLVEIWQGYEDDTDADFPRFFRGTVQVTKPSWLTTELICEDGGVGMRGKGLPAVIQRPCRHILYSADCGVSKAAFDTLGTASAASGSVVTVAAAAGQANGYYSGGILTYGTTYQMIVKHVGSTLTLLAPAGTLEADIAATGAKNVYIAPGCPRSIAVCESRFNNSLNHGGFPYIEDSPFDGRSVE